MDGINDGMKLILPDDMKDASSDGSNEENFDRLLEEKTEGLNEEEALGFATKVNEGILLGTDDGILNDWKLGLLEEAENKKTDGPQEREIIGSFEGTWLRDKLGYKEETNEGINDGELLGMPEVKNERFLEKNFLDGFDNGSLDEISGRKKECISKFDRFENALRKDELIIRTEDGTEL